MKKNNESFMSKKAFTIPELMIFMVIVGVISVCMMTIIKPNEKALKYQYYNAYNTLKTATYNVMQDAMDASDSDQSYSETDKKFPETAKELCKKLAVNRDTNDNYGYINTAKYNCISGPTVSKSAKDKNDFTDAKMAFQSSNSMKYYITQKDSYSFPDELGANFEMDYFVVWVDLNGNKGPNTAEIKKGRLPDIVPFVITSNGNVIPVGIPTTDRRYLQATVTFVSDDNEESYSDPMNFYSAQVTAFGSKEYPSSDFNSIRDSWDKVFQGTAIVPTTFPKDVSQSSKCRVNAGDVPNCLLEIVEEKGFYN